MTPRRSRVLVLVLAGGVGSRLSPLTERRAKPSLPFAGMYRLIDIALTNVAHSQLNDVWVLEQYRPHDLNDHLANGRAWDLDRTRGGLQILPPYQPDADGDVVDAAGNADALVQHRELIAAADVDIVVTMSADHVYRLDLRDVLDTHAAADADLTIVSTTPPAGDDPGRFAWVTVDDGRVTDFAYKPDGPAGDRVCTEIFVFGADVLVDGLARLPTDGSAADYGDTLLPDLVERATVVDHELDGYWRDVGTIGAYHDAHLELLGADPPLRLDDPSWPFLTTAVDGGPARLLPTARVVNTLVSPGALIGGDVARSVVGRGCHVEEGAVVRDAVLLDGAVVRAGARITRAVVDVETEVTSEQRPSVDEASGVAVYHSPA